VRVTMPSAMSGSLSREVEIVPLNTGRDPPIPPVPAARRACTASAGAFASGALLDPRRVLVDWSHARQPVHRSELGHRPRRHRRACRRHGPRQGDDQGVTVVRALVFGLSSASPRSSRSSWS
jgi:hypothetical protein